MNKSNCQIHDQEEQKYICVHPVCLKKAENKLCCVQCFTTSHKKKKLGEHQFTSISELQKKANINYQGLIQHYNELIEKNQQLQNEIETKLQEILNSIVTWQSNQKKMFNDVADYSNSVLTQNILKADSLFKNPTLDTIIYFYVIDLQKIQTENKDITKSSLRNLQYQLQDIEAKRDILVTQTTYFKKENFLKFKQMDYLIEIDNLNDFEFQKCSKHFSKRKMLCTHPECLQNPQNNLYCLNCIQQEHLEHSNQKYVKPIAEIQKEQTEKKSKIQELQNKICQDIQGFMDKNFTKINQNQEIQYKNFENLKEKGIFLELQQLNEIQNSKSSEYIFDNIDLNLLQVTKDQIEQEYMLLYYNFETKFSTIFEQKVNDDLQFCTELDQNSKKFFKYVINLEQELQICQKKIESQQQVISNYLNKISLTNSTDEESERKKNIEKNSKAEIQQLNCLQEIKNNLEKLDLKLQDIHIKEEVQKSSQKLDLLQTNLNNLNEIINDVKKNTQISNTKLTSLNNESDASFKELKTNASNLSTKLQNLNSGINALDVTIKAVQTNSTDSNTKLVNLSQNVNALEQSIQKLKEFTQTQGDQLERTQSNINEAIKTNTKNQNSIVDLNQRITTLCDKTIPSQNNQFQNLTTGINDLDVKINDVKKNSEDQNTNLSNLSQNVKTLDATIKAVEMDFLIKACICIFVALLVSILGKLVGIQ